MKIVVTPFVPTPFALPSDRQGDLASGGCVVRCANNWLSSGGRVVRCANNWLAFGGRVVRCANNLLAFGGRARPVLNREARG